MPGAWGHLALRFVDVVTARPLQPSELQAVRRWLSDPDVTAAFFQQSGADQRHGYRAARHTEEQAPGRLDLVRAALVHDIGKRHARLGPIGRSLASVAIRLRLPLTPRWALYRDHGALGSAEMAGMEQVVVEFARSHHHERPVGIAPSDWDVLTAADSPRVGR